MFILYYHTFFAGLDPILCCTLVSQGLARRPVEIEDGKDLYVESHLETVSSLTPWDSRYVSEAVARVDADGEDEEDRVCILGYEA